MRLATPSYEGDTGLFRLSSAYVLPEGQGGLQPLPRQLRPRPQGYRFLDPRLEHRLRRHGQARDLRQHRHPEPAEGRTTSPQPGFYNELPFRQLGLGDRLRRHQARAPSTPSSTTTAATASGLAVRGLVKFGTADEAKGLGTGKTGGALDLILSKNLNYKADLHASIGYQFERRDPGRRRNIGGAFKWGMGVNVPACAKSRSRPRSRAESTATPASTRRARSTSSSGPVFWFRPGFFVRPAWSYALNYDAAGPAGASRRSPASRSPSAITRGRAAARSTLHRLRPRPRPTGRPRCPSTA